MVEFADIPNDGNFSGWRSFLEDKVNSCDGTLRGYSLTWGQQVFSSFDDANKAAALESALDGGTIGHDYLFPKRGGEFAFVIIAIILFILGIVAACALTKCLRKCISRALCGRCRDRDRVRMKDAPPHDRSFLCVAHVVACLSIISLGILSYIATAQSFIGLKSASCNMWQQLYGHYFGTSSLNAGEYEGIAFNWQGTDSILSSIADIGAQATPDANGESAIYKRMRDGYLQMKDDATLKANETNALMQEFMDNATIFDAAVRTVNSWALPLTVEAANYKGEIFQKELNSTLETGWVEIERILDYYAGADAALTQDAVASADASTVTIQQVDLVIAQLAKLWKDASPLLSTLVYLVGSIEIIAVTVGIELGCVLLWLTFKLLSALRHDKLISKKQRTFWAVSYGTACVLAGLFALLCSIHVMTAAVGSDACLMAEDAVFTRGNWNVLGESILHPVDNMQVNVKAVLDTCVRADGNGDVASALGLDGRIRMLAEDVVVAQADVSDTREKLLQRKEKGTRAQVLQLGFHDVAQMISIGRTSEADNGQGIPLPRFGVWNETRAVRADIDYGYADHGPRSVLCLVPRMPLSTAWTLYTCLGEGLQIDVAPMNVVADTVNYALDQIGITDGSVPRAFCSALLKEAKHPCASMVSEGDDGWITAGTNWWDANDAYPTTKNITDWTKTINNTPLVKNAPKKSRYDIAGDKFAYAIGKWKELERMAAWNMEGPPSALSNETDRFYFCPDNTKTCTFKEYRENADGIFTTRSAEISPAVTDLFAIVDAYVDDIVNPTMESLVIQANAITDKGNCQFEGTALHYSVLPPVCEAVFPANAVSSIFTGLLSLIFFLLAIHVFKWYHYLSDLARAHGGSTSQYELTKEASPMNQNKNFVLYSGVPTATQTPQSQSPVPQANAAFVIQQDVQQPVNNAIIIQQREAVHANEPSTPLINNATQEPPSFGMPTHHTRQESYKNNRFQSGDSFATNQG